MKINETVNQIIYESLKKNGITLDMISPEKSIIADLGADSLDIIEMMLAFEEKFNVSINEENINNIVTIGDIYKYVKNQNNYIVKTI